MPRRDDAPVGAPCWVDLFTSDPEKSQAFYGQLFGWTADEPNEEFGGYFNFSKDGVHVAGGMKNDGTAGVPDMWSVYLAATDAKATVDTAVAKGAQVIVPAMDVGDMGAMAVLADPGGAAVGVWQPGTHKGFGILSEVDTPSWFELHARDYDGAVAFYRDVFGWDTHTAGDEPGFRYTTLGEGDEALAGIMDASGFLPDGVPANWQVYFQVADADAALDTVTELGGAVIQPAEDTPYGRLAQATDATGGAFRILAR